jgi:predicted transcriptional regulator YheO
MDAMVTDAIREVGKPVGQMSRDDRITVLTKLDQQGALQMRKGIESIAARLGISRVTAYAYLDEARNHESQAGDV